MKVKIVNFAKIEFVFFGITIVATLMVFILLKINLSQSADISIQHFMQQNRYEIANSDTLALATKLNALMASETISCVFGHIGSTVFIETSKNGHCKPRIWLSQKMIISPTNPELNIGITYQMPLPLIYSNFIILIAQTLLSLIFFKIHKQKVFLDTQVKEQFLDIAIQLAHDIRSPLSALNLLTESLPELPKEQKDMFISIGIRINQISNNILNKIKDRSFTPTNFKIKDKLSQNTEVLSTCKRIIAEKKLTHKNLKFITNFDNKEFLNAKFPSDEFERIISNLLNNSIEAIEPSTGEISISLQEYKTKIEIKITDNGCGICEENLNKAFSKGFTNGKKEGNGLGLYYARRKVMEWGGEISISSQENVGTMITMILKK